MTGSQTKQSAYKKAGVDIDAGVALVERIKPFVKTTNRNGVMGGLGGFGALFDLKAAGYKDPILVSSTDGVGTKLKIAIETKRHDTVGIDLVAMCVNDLIVQGAEPLFFLDYFASGKLSVENAAAVIASIAKGCEEAGCALIGGETAEMPGVYAGEDYDLAGFTVGAVERNRLITGEHIQEGDTILGLASSGVHSNGFSLVRKLIGSTPGVSYSSPAPFAAGQTIGDSFLTPTRIYVKPVLKALKIEDKDKQPVIKGMAHITGGGLLENIPRCLPEGLDAVLDTHSWPFLPVFQWLMNIGDLEPIDMARTFNCGIGMVIVCASSHAEALMKDFQSNHETLYRIGRVERGTQTVRLEHLESAWTKN